ncbi:MAG: DUF5056 domain-containing protein [Prevotellaceae bacterium]|jgi:hypothetical protein|nr:DUF5056 domain-containing protein [Prevotellaceae bacterium]
MTDSTSAPDWGKWFKAHRQEPADNGFTEALMRRLPPRPSLLPQAAIALGVAGVAIAGFFVFLAVVLDFSVIIGSVKNLGAAADTPAILSLSSWLNAALSSLVHAANAAVAAIIATAVPTAAAAFLSPLSVGVAAVALMVILILALTDFWENREVTW